MESNPSSMALNEYMGARSSSAAAQRISLAVFFLRRRG
jgi:hypothetical protein